MLNNIQAHNHTVYSYWQALLTDRHKVSTLCSETLFYINTTLIIMDTLNNLCNRNDVDESGISIIQLTRRILSLLYISSSFILFCIYQPFIMGF